jgi:SH3-like domain-containing protein
LAFLRGAAPVIAAAAMGVMPAAFAPVALAAAAPTERKTPSGYPVPRYITLKFPKVNARAGPSEGHRVKFVYRTRGLPLQVVAETSEWRRVCDPEGQVTWVHKRVTDGRRNVINMGDRPAPLYRAPKAGAEPIAYLNVRALAAFVRCEDGWCKVKPQGARAGWVREGALWGSSEALQCR